MRHIKHLFILFLILIINDYSYSRNNEQFSIKCKLPKYIVCFDKETCDLNYQTLEYLLDGNKSNIRYFTSSSNKFGTEEKFVNKNNYLDSNIILFRDGESNMFSDKLSLMDFYEYVGNYWDFEKSNRSNNDVRQLKKEYLNKMFDIQLVSFQCSLKDDLSNIKGTVTKDNLEDFRYYLKSIKLNNSNNNPNKQNYNELERVLPFPFFEKEQPLSVSLDSVKSLILSEKRFKKTSNGNILFDSLYGYGREYGDPYGHLNTRYPANLDKQLDLLQENINTDIVVNWKYIFCEDQQHINLYKNNKIYYNFTGDGKYIDECMYESDGYDRPRIPRYSCNIYTSFFLTKKSNDYILEPSLIPSENISKPTFKDSLIYGNLRFRFNNSILYRIEYFNRYTSTTNDLDPLKIKYTNNLVKFLNRVLGKPKIFTKWYGKEYIDYVYDYGKSKIILQGMGKGFYKHEKRDPFRIFRIIYQNDYVGNELNFFQ